VRQMLNFPSIEEAVGANSTSPQGVAAREVWEWFQDHLDALLDSMRAFRFDQFEVHIRTFWSNLSPPHREVVHAPAIAGLMAKADAILYDEILELLRSQMLSPIAPASLAGLRQLADKMEKILLVALESYGNTFVEPKVELGARFGHLVMRFLDMYQVTQALSTVLTSPKQLIEMRRSWSKVDFDSVRNQSALVCNCRHEELSHLLEVDFVQLLDGLSKSSDPVRDVMAWADKCCDKLMGGRANEERATMSSRSILIRWGYVTSQVMRDLTIRSDPAFGAFQILKLFLDDWIALNVLRNVALSTNSVAASVEPVMQQQFFSLSPMAGQETFGNLDVRPVMAHTPTTSSMLAALQADTFGSGLDPTSSSFGADAFSSLGFMDTAATPEDSIHLNSSSISYSDYTSGPSGFDVAGFTPQDLGLSASGTPPSTSSEPDSEVDLVKTES
jgi:regulatory factor X, other